MMLKQNHLKAMLDRLLPKRWRAYDWRKVGSNIVKFVDWKKGL